MVTIRVSTVVPAPPETVWADLREIGDHVQWMADAEAIRFAGPQRRGAGVRFDCVTRVGPIRLTDRMEVTDWVDGQVLGIRHRGLVSGKGQFRLAAKSEPGGEIRTEFAWTETLRFPWRLGGPAGEALARPILRRMWRRNLRAFSARF